MCCWVTDQWGPYCVTGMGQTEYRRHELALGFQPQRAWCCLEDVDVCGGGGYSCNCENPTIKSLIEQKDQGSLSTVISE